MKILILTFYYPPDLSAGSFRSKALVTELLKILPENSTIDILSTLPNRYASFKQSIDENLPENEVVKRFRVPGHKSGLFDQAWSFIVYLFKVLAYTRSRKYDVVFATSSRLMTAFLGSLVANKKKLPLVLDIRDIFTDTISSVFQKRYMKLIVFFFRAIEKRTINSATAINLVSEGFVGYFSEIRSDIEYSVITNGIDSEFLEQSFKKTHSTERKIITYAGNLGQGQGLEKIIPGIAANLGPEYEIRIIGDGGMKTALVDKISQAGIENIEYINPVSRDILIQYYRESDFLFLHLNNYKAFEKVLPSKVFEYGATGKPVLAGVKGYAAEFIRSNLSDNWLLFEPADVDDFIMKFKTFRPAGNISKEFIDRFDRKRLMSELAGIIFDTGRNAATGK